MLSCEIYVRLKSLDKKKLEQFNKQMNGIRNDDIWKNNKKSVMT